MFDPTKPVQTRDGRKARIICSDRKHPGGQLLLVSLITNSNGVEEVSLHAMNGSVLAISEHHNDLINIPVKVEIYNFCSPTGSTFSPTWVTLEGIKMAHKESLVPKNAYGVLKKTYIDDKLSAVELVHIF
jgi:hypothetical protein